MSDTSVRPYQRLPMPMPCDFDPSDDEPDYFYNNFVHHFIPDMLRMTTTGLNIDQKAVEELRTTIDKVLDSVTETLASSAVIAEYQEKRYPKLFAKYKEETLKSIRTVTDYTKPYNNKNIVHRTYLVNCYLEDNEHNQDTKEKWTVKELKDYNLWIQSSFIDRVISNQIEATNVYAVSAMVDLAEDKLELWNRPRYNKVEQGITVPPFNPASSLNKKEFFEMVGSSVLSRSKDTGEASWGRKEIEVLLKETPEGDLKNVLQAFIDHSFSGIIKNNFLSAFDSYTIDDVLYGNIKLFGAKSFRNTSNSPNLLNMPSSGSIYAKPLKKCFIPPKGMLVYAIDYSALEDRVIANLSGDVNKLSVFTDGIDGHSLAAIFYDPKEAENIVGKFKSIPEAAKKLKKMVDAEIEIAIKFRQKYKATSFGLAYGKFPDSDSGGIITQKIFDSYHKELYPQITKYRENYVLPYTKENGYIHLGLGCRLLSDNAETDIRTLNNATCQFWSILTLIAINELNYRIYKEGLEHSIQVTSTIYDSVYLNVENDSSVIKWLNDTLVEIMNVNYIKGEIVHNECVGEIGTDWSNLKRLNNNASIQDIKTLLLDL